jgi:hypothetical protein
MELRGELEEKSCRSEIMRFNSGCELSYMCGRSYLDALWLLFHVRQMVLTNI